MIVYKTFPLGGRCLRRRRMRGITYRTIKHLTPHQSKIKDFCQLLPREKLYAKQSFTKYKRKSDEYLNVFLAFFVRYVIMQ